MQQKVSNGTVFFSTEGIQAAFPAEFAGGVGPEDLSAPEKSPATAGVSPFPQAAPCVATCGRG
jgi:hypothetical protein